MPPMAQVKAWSSPILRRRFRDTAKRETRGTEMTTTKDLTIVVVEKDGDRAIAIAEAPKRQRMRQIAK